jgi:hypothetical protein
MLLADLRNNQNIPNSQWDLWNNEPPLAYTLCMVKSQSAPCLVSDERSERIGSTLGWQWESGLTICRKLDKHNATGEPKLEKLVLVSAFASGAAERFSLGTLGPVANPTASDFFDILIQSIVNKPCKFAVWSHEVVLELAWAPARTCSSGYKFTWAHRIAKANRQAGTFLGARNCPLLWLAN